LQPASGYADENGRAMAKGASKPPFHVSPPPCARVFVAGCAARGDRQRNSYGAQRDVRISGLRVCSSTLSHAYTTHMAS